MRLLVFLCSFIRAHSADAPAMTGQGFCSNGGEHTNLSVLLRVRAIEESDVSQVLRWSRPAHRLADVYKKSNLRNTAGVQAGLVDGSGDH